jgi:hypothetical protein
VPRSPATTNFWDPRRSERCEDRERLPLCSGGRGPRPKWLIWRGEPAGAAIAGIDQRPSGVARPTLPRSALIRRRADIPRSSKASCGLRAEPADLSGRTQVAR